jgi:hypothetical protein
MSGIVSRWPVLEQHAVDTTQLDVDGAVRADLACEWIAAACDSYLQRCPLLQNDSEPDDLEIQCSPVALPAGALSGRPTSVAISVGVSEFFPTSFTMTIRIRPFGGEDDRVVNLARDVTIANVATGDAQPLRREVRDELIAHAHAARYTN